MFTRIFFILFLFYFSKIFGRTYEINRRDDNEIKLDGNLSEKQWEGLQVASDFVVNTPVFGNKSRFNTKIKLFYTNEALYIGGELFDPSPDSISYSLSKRDDYGNADWFAVDIDPYNTKTNGFRFALTSTGVQIDAIAFTSYEDYSWNAVWKSAVKKTSFGWSFEIKIPYSAIRFPNLRKQIWRVNFYRGVRRIRETSSWNPVNPDIFGKLTQTGEIIGIENIKSPFRLSFTPYATSYIENTYSSIDQKQVWRRRFTGGMDVKWGINDAFTLDMTLIPDFGQTQSDNQVLNLGPFEQYYRENRPFFLEGMDLFGIAGVFYTRRIGGRPIHQIEVFSQIKDSSEKVIKNPNQNQLLNASKISGRTNSGLGIGLFNAIENKTFAVIKDSLGKERLYQTNPLTNYNVFILSQNLPNNSTISFVNTNVLRPQGERSANVSVGEASLYTKNRNYKIYSKINISSIVENNEIEFGHLGNVEIEKVSGTWRYKFNYSETSDRYDHNDLGFMYRNDSRSYRANIRWNYNKISNLFYKQSAGLFLNYNSIYHSNDYTKASLHVRYGGLLKNQTYTAVSLNAIPFGSVDYFEARVPGKKINYGKKYNFSYFFSTDYSKRFALDMDLALSKFLKEQQVHYSINIEPRFRVSDNFFLIFENYILKLNGDYGFVQYNHPSFPYEVLIGTRDRINVENVLSSEFLFTNRMGVNLRLRHYWSQVKYKYISVLEETGNISAINVVVLDPSSYNTSFDAFSIDLVYQWFFLPGSELNIVYKNNIITSDNLLNEHYFETFSTLFDEPQNSSLSMRILFYIDVLYFRKKHKTLG